jgi:hypothetical protein
MGPLLIDDMRVRCCYGTMRRFVGAIGALCDPPDDHAESN